MYNFIAYSGFGISPNSSVSVNVSFGIFGTGFSMYPKMSSLLAVTSEEASFFFISCNNASTLLQIRHMI